MKAIWNTANGSKAFNAFVWCKGKDASGFMVLEWRFSKLKVRLKVNSKCNTTHHTHRENESMF